MASMTVLINYLTQNIKQYYQKLEFTTIIHHRGKSSIFVIYYRFFEILSVHLFLCHTLHIMIINVGASNSRLARKLGGWRIHCSSIFHGHIFVLPYFLLTNFLLRKITSWNVKLSCCIRYLMIIKKLTTVALVCMWYFVLGWEKAMEM